MKKLGLLSKIITAIILGIIVGIIMPDPVIRVLATFNGLFGEFLGFVIPLIIIGFIAPGIGTLGKGAGKQLGITTGLAYLSTISAGLIAYLAAITIYPLLLKGQNFNAYKNPEEALLAPYFTIQMDPIMGVMAALLFSFIIGIGIASIEGGTLSNATNEFRRIIEKLITKVIIPLLPFHILGIFSNMTNGGQVSLILSVFLKVFVMIICLHIFYLIGLYGIAGSIVKQNPFRLLKEMAPAYFTALGTQSSASTIPVTLRHAKNLGARDKVTEFSIPLLATIHLSGSTITLVSCGIAVMVLSGLEVSFSSIFPFILMLGITMIAAPGVPGGAVMAALGLLESMLGFDGTMIALMIALYLAQDSFGTACNVTGDGALTVMADRLTVKEESTEKFDKIAG